MKKYGTNKILDALVNDKNWYVRKAVAEQGYGLDKLINDKDWYVRAAVAERGYKLDKLVNDKNYKVRAAVAKQGYGLNKLISDKDKFVYNSICHYLKENGLTFDEWKEKYPEKVVKE